MKRAVQFAILAIVTLSTFGGCRKDSPVSLQAEDRYVYTSSSSYWEQVFDDYWEVMNQSYVFWMEEELDWDQIYGEYHPQFVALDEMRASESDRYDATSRLYSDTFNSYLCYGDSLGVATFKAITSQLSDYHYDLTLDDVGCTIVGAWSEYYERDYYHMFDYSGFNSGVQKTIAAGIADGSITDYCAGTYVDSSGEASNPMSLYSYRQDGDIAYFRLSSWNICASYNTPVYRGENNLSEVLENFYDIVRNTPDLKGAIIDVRNNAGGYNYDLNYVLGEFINVDDKLFVGYTRHKSGPNRLDYTSYVPSYLYGSSEEESIRFPIAVLADINSCSMSEQLCFAADAFSEDSIVVGERTFGATCSLCDEMYLSGGVASNSNFTITTASALCYYGEDKVFYEGIGVTPDIEVFYDTNWGATTTDTQKQTAIDYLKSL